MPQESNNYNIASTANKNNNNHNHQTLAQPKTALPSELNTRNDTVIPSDQWLTKETSTAVELPQPDNRDT